MFNKRGKCMNKEVKIFSSWCSNEDLIKEYFPDGNLEMPIDEAGYGFWCELSNRVEDGRVELVNKVHMGVVSDGPDHDRAEDLTIYTYQDNKYVFVINLLIHLDGGEYGNWGGGVLHHASVIIYHRW